MSKVIPLWKSRFMKHNAMDMTPAELAARLDISKNSVYNYFKYYGIKYLSEVERKKLDRVLGPLAVRKQVVRFVERKETPMRRPPAEYTNRTPYGIATPGNGESIF